MADSDLFSPWSIKQSKLIETGRDEKNAFLELHCVGLELREGDTLVFVDFPGIGRNGKTPVDCAGVPFRSQEFRVHSENLLATGSPRFAEMLQPSHQFRVQRRRKVANKLPEGVKYVLDLTPPSEGDDMVFQVTELSLTPGIIKWWMAYASQGVLQCLVKGHDDCCVCRDVLSRPGYDSSREQEKSNSMLHNATTAYESKAFVVALPPTPTELSELRDRCVRSVVEPPEYYRIPDYCPIRHRNGIIRLLMLIEGKDVALNSAARMWTLVALSKIWDCTSSVESIVSTWMLYENNSRFIEVLPEEALKIGFALENAPITQCAFEILVNEMALEEAATSGSGISYDSGHTTIFGRRKGFLDDEVQNLVQHAARALVDRASKLLLRLLHKDLFDDWNMPEWDRLISVRQALECESDEDARIALACVEKLVQDVREIIYSDVKAVLQGSAPALPRNYKTINEDRATYVEPLDYQLCEDIVLKMNPVQRLLLSFPYRELDSMWDKSLFLGGELRRLEQIEPDIIPMDNYLAMSLLRMKRKGLSAISESCWDVIFGPSPGNLFPRLEPYFNIGALEVQVRAEMRKITDCCFRFGDGPHANITRHLLLMLKTNELKYLPLWAGGNNDGTGGVFEDDLPPAEMGPSGPGPAYHTGVSIPSAPSSLAGSFVDDLADLDLGGSATAASVDVHDSISTVYRPDQVIADDKSIASQSFHTNDSDYQEARDAKPKAEYSVSGSGLSDDCYMSDSDDDYASTIGADEFEADQISDSDEEHALKKEQDLKSDKDMVLV